MIKSRTMDMASILIFYSWYCHGFQSPQTPSYKGELFCLSDKGKTSKRVHIWNLQTVIMIWRRSCHTKKIISLSLFLELGWVGELGPPLSQIKTVTFVILSHNSILSSHAFYTDSKVKVFCRVQAETLFFLGENQEKRVICSISTLIIEISRSFLTTLSHTLSTYFCYFLLFFFFMSVS